MVYGIFLSTKNDRPDYVLGVPKAFAKDIETARRKCMDLLKYKQKTYSTDIVTPEGRLFAQVAKSTVGGEIIYTYHSKRDKHLRQINRDGTLGPHYTRAYASNVLSSINPARRDTYMSRFY